MSPDKTNRQLDRHLIISVSYTSPKPKIVCTSSTMKFLPLLSIILTVVGPSYAYYYPISRPVQCGIGFAARSRLVGVYSPSNVSPWNRYGFWSVEYGKNVAMVSFFFRTCYFRRSRKTVVITGDIERRQPHGVDRGIKLDTTSGLNQILLFSGRSSSTRSNDKQTNTLFSLSFLRAQMLQQLQ